MFSSEYSQWHSKIADLSLNSSGIFSGCLWKIEWCWRWCWRTAQSWAASKGQTQTTCSLARGRQGGWMLQFSCSGRHRVRWRTTTWQHSRSPPEWLGTVIQGCVGRPLDTGKYTCSYLSPPIADRSKRPPGWPITYRRVTTFSAATTPCLVLQWLNRYPPLPPGTKGIKW